MMETTSPSTGIEDIFFARPLPGLLWAVLIIAVIAVALFLYRRESALSPLLRGSLVVMRVLVLVLLLVALFEPVAVVREKVVEKKSLAVVLDVSRSMAITDQRKRSDDVEDAAVALGLMPLKNRESDGLTGRKLGTRDRKTIAGSSRLELAKSLVAKSAAGMFGELGEDLNIRYYQFGDSLKVLGQGGEEGKGEIAALKAEAKGTSIAESLQEVANAHRGESLSGIVLLSDGIDNGALQPETVAYDLGVRGIPVYTLPTGIPEPDDISIRNVIVQDVAFVGDTVPVRVHIRSRGYEKRTTNLLLFFNGKELEPKEVTLEGGLQFVDLSFDARIREKGAVPLEIRVEPFPDEATSDNNRFTRSIRVVNEKINVLCIEGSARWEFRYLRAILKRDPRINATFIATRAGNDLALHSSDYIARFPEDAEYAFKFDLVILGDVDSSFFTAGEFTRLEELIRDRGGSLLMLAGPHHSPTSYGGTVVEGMLPVGFNPGEKWKDIDKSVYPVLTSEGRSSQVLTLERDRDKNDRLWTHVAPMDRLPPLLDLRPGASALAVLSDSGVRTTSYPLISWHRYGTGKCMFIATDRLWRLRFRTGDKYHWRVWSQCIQFLTLSRLMGEHRQIRMETDRVSYPVGEQVRVYAEVLDDSFEPLLQENYDVYVGRVEEGEEEGNALRVRLRPESTRPGLYVGYYAPMGTGRYRIQASEDDRPYANTIEFQVADVLPEMAETDAQVERLQRISGLSGGKCLKLSRVGELATALDRTQRETIVTREKPLWDNWIFALLVIGLAGTEWIIRRRRDLS